MIDTLNTAVNTIGTKIDNFKASAESGGVPIVRRVQNGNFYINTSNESTIISLSGFSNLSKMIVLINGSRTSSGSTSSQYLGPYVENANSMYLFSMALNSLTIICKKGSDREGWAYGSYQVIEFY